MVISFGDVTLFDALLLAQEKAPLIKRLSPEQKVKLLAALAGFVILGCGMVALIWLGARVTRRYMNQEPLHRLDPAHRQDDWTDVPLVPPERDESDSEEDT